MSKFVVAKYGGTSMAQPAVVAELLAAHPEQNVIVCSAPGVSANFPSKVTDMLIELAGQRKAGTDTGDLVEAVGVRFTEVLNGLDKDFRMTFLASLRHDLNSSRGQAFMVSRGEYYSAAALAERVNGQLVDAQELFFFDEQGELDRSRTSQAIKATIDPNKRTIVPGFYGSGPGETICLFGRGGSDRSGAVLASALGYDYHNWTDVDGVLSADPRMVQNARLIPELTYEEVREGAHGGSGVLMGDTILDLDYGDSVTRLLNTFNPSAPGTTITRTRATDDARPVVAISGQDDLVALSINDLGMRDQSGYVAHILEIVAAAGISIEHMPAAQDAITFTFHKSDLDDSALAGVIEQIKTRFVSPSASYKTIDCGVVYLVGEGLRHPELQHAVTIKTLEQLDSHEISALTIIMNPSSPSVAVLVPAGTAAHSIQILHAAFFG